MHEGSLQLVHEGSLQLGSPNFKLIIILEVQLENAMMTVIINKLKVFYKSLKHPEKLTAAIIYS